MNKFAQYRLLMSKFFYYQNRKMEKEEDEIADQLDKIWYSSTADENEIMRKLLILKDGAEFKKFNDTWRAYHKDGNHKPTYKTYNNGYMDVKYRYTNLTSFHYLTYMAVNGIIPTTVFAHCRDNKDFPYRVEYMLRMIKYPTSRKNILESLQSVFGDIIKDEHLDRIVLYAKYVK